MVPYDTIRHDVRNGDIAIWKNPGVVGRVDRWSHCSRFFWFGHTLLLVEFMEFRGGQVVTARDQIRKHPGSMSVFRPQSMAGHANKAVELMLRQVGKPYGWHIIAKQLWQRAGLLRLITGKSYDTHDMTPMEWDEPKDCSAAVVWSDRMAMGEVVKRHWPCQCLSDWSCTPENVAFDPFYQLRHEDVYLEDDE